MLCGCSRKREPKLAAEDPTVPGSQWRHHCCWFCSALVTWAHRPSQGPLSLLAQHSSDPSTGRWEGPGKGPEKTLLLFSWAGVCPRFYHCSKPALHTGLWLLLSAAQPALKNWDVCMCAPAEGVGRLGFQLCLCSFAPMDDWHCSGGPPGQALSPGWLSLKSLSLSSPSASRAKQHDKVRHGWFSIDSLASNFLQCTKTRQLSHCLCTEVSGVLHTTGYSLSVCLSPCTCTEGPQQMQGWKMAKGGSCMSSLELVCVWCMSSLELPAHYIPEKN